MVKGISITQEGIDLKNASDYQKVLDSRWLFFEVGLELDETVSFADLGTPTAHGFQRVNIVKHGLAHGGNPYVPAFHASWKRSNSNTSTIGVSADDTWIYAWREYWPSAATGAFNLEVMAKVYRLPILVPYSAPIESAPPTFKQNTGVGLRALDGSNAIATVNNRESTGYSVDTQKKILSINKIIRAQIGFESYQTAAVTNIDTSTNVWTIQPDPREQQSPDGKFAGLTWVETGNRVSYSPGDFSTMPSPITFGMPLYVIKLSDNAIQLAASYADAIAGVPIDVTTSGALPGKLTNIGKYNPELKVSGNSIVEHGAAYPPSYLYCDVIYPGNKGANGMAVGPFYEYALSPLVLSGPKYLQFRGIQAQFVGELSVVIIKDPIEVAA